MITIYIQKLLKKGLWAAAAVVALSTACSKKEYHYEKMPYKDIASFKLVGYTGDSINAAIENNTIIIYWAAETPLPATIKPAISVSARATIAPASGEEVAFSANTVYTVTAEDGSKQTYHLKPVINQAIPKILTIKNNILNWYSNTTLSVTGEYFLSGDTSDVHVYAQRIKDGYEFDLPIDYSNITMTSITANLPSYTNQMDTGNHRIYVKIGNRVSEEKIINIRYPDIYGNNLLHFQFLEAGKTMAAGDSLTLRFWDDYNGNITRWYAKKFQRIVMESYTFNTSDLAQTDSTITFKIPDTPISMYPFYYINVFYIAPGAYTNNTTVYFTQDQLPVIPAAK